MTKLSMHRSASVLAGAYRIRVRGGLDPKWADCLGGMSISTDEQEEIGIVTTLFGQVPDQAALFGILNVLYDLHCSLLLVERVNESAET